MNNAVITAFPPSLTTTVIGLATMIDPPASFAPRFQSSVLCAGDRLTIPGRIYCRVPDQLELTLLSNIEQFIVASWFTRHNDGYVRERFLRLLPVYDQAWVIAYIVALCGEYVIQILRAIWERRNLFDPVVLGQWLRDNQPFYDQTRSRIISYWNCYYRKSFPRFTDYVGSHILAFFDECLILPLS